MATAKIVELNDTNTCKICDNALAKYSCPRCNILYCSLTCYQSTSHLSCSEDFYKENVMTELGLDFNNPESKTKMLEILQRNHEQNRISTFDDNDNDSSSDVDLDDIGLNHIGAHSQFVDIEDLEEDIDSDDDEFVDIAERLAGVNIDDADVVWSKLTEDERQSFVSFLRNGDVSKFITSWKPWWLYSENDTISEVNAEGEGDFKSKCPNMADIKDFSSITNKTPADCVKYNLINVLSAYIFTARYFNGDHFEFPQEAVACVATLSLALKKGVNFTSEEEAVKSVEQQCISTEWIVTDSENLDLMKEDLTKVLKGPNQQEKNFYILCALSDFYNLLKECQKPKKDEPTGMFSKQFPNSHFPQVQHETKEKIKKYLKKTDYFLSFAKDILSI